MIYDLPRRAEELYQTKLNSEPEVQVSDTREADQGTEAGNIKIVRREA